MPRFGWKNFEVNRRMSPDSAILQNFLFYQYNYVVGLLQGFMINAHESGSNSPGAGTLSRDLNKTKSCSAGILPGLCIWKKSLSPLFLGPQGTWLQMTGA